ncbi:MULTISPECIES: glycine betaine ABC transporter substrate-binding protein [Vibrio]|uniref:ABC transporter substrate-binding protein n=2 Tax=Vibrio casei TaxID=673372 RepID=A0A368LN16_9VIBR|nr:MULTISPECIES: glycine betaine ABC transporter substrate-binding protein [Vibrio]RCS73272.1 ABC transporter substrate-binding protein [Vibrio casei]SJN18382.1 L-proline glycine betaine binding ABC transporter protein ProX (TC 3.A.1.12.1) [Vibrio casei]HBV75738.1 ABC transporter substrate-binding protein [Vibrio sp.]
MKRLLCASTFLLASTFPLPSFASGCGSVSIADMNWSSATLMAHVDKFILEHAYHCDVELVPGDTVPTTTSMVEKGEPDIAPELWSNSAKELLENGVKEKRLRFAVQSLSDGGEEGYWIPQYMVDKDPSLATIEGVKANATLFTHPEDDSKYAFYTCPAGWTCQISAGHIFDALQLKKSGFEQVDPGSGAALAATIAKAYSRQEPWFGYYWAPTAVLGKYPMVKVEFGKGTDAKHYQECITQVECKNPKPIMWPPSKVDTVVTESFATRAPDAMSYLSKRAYTNKQMNNMLAWMEDNQADGEMAMEEFMLKHKDIWSTWLTGQALQSVESAVNQL